MDDLEIFMMFFLIVATYSALTVTEAEEDDAEPPPPPPPEAEEDIDIVPQKRAKIVDFDKTNGYFDTCFNNLRNDQKGFFKHTRMTPGLYDMLLTLLKDDLTKGSQRQAISPECRLAVTLTYLSQGISHQSLSWTFNIGRTTIRSVILETCELIWKCLSPVYVSEPSQEDFMHIADDFQTIWDLPNCVGAIDGKHITIKNPRAAESEVYNQEEIYILATCDARYRFTFVDIGSYGGKGGILTNSELGKRLSGNKLNIPVESVLPNTTIKFPYYFIGNAEFPLKKNLLRVYPDNSLDKAKKVFNYRISRGHVSIENAFGILVSRWKILQNTLTCFSENAEKIVLATIALHNFILKFQPSSQIYCPHGGYADNEDEHGNVIPGRWRNEKNSIFLTERMGSNNAPVTIFQQRDILKKYFINEGKIELQDAQIL